VVQIHPPQPTPSLSHRFRRVFSLKTRAG